MRLAMLNGMADSDFGKSLDLQKSWGIVDLDLKDSIFGKSIIDLSDDEAQKAMAMITSHGMQAYCLSTNLFHDDIAKGEVKFAVDNLSKVLRIITIAKILKPRFIRLLPAKISNRSEVKNSVDWIKKNAPWLLNQYRQAIKQIIDAGFEATIENEVFGCIFGSPEEIISFFAEIKDTGASYTWDIQNLWQCGHFPLLDTYHKLKPLIKYVHVKGGIKNPQSNELEWAAPLAEASWPVKAILGEVVRDKVSPVICINPSHGKWKPDFSVSATAKKDVDYLMATFSRERS